jgi:GNAT superfamily N-acetyltransferase
MHRRSEASLSEVMSVRRADAGDLSEILRIDPRADAGDAERIEYLTRAVDRDVCLVATDDDAAYGFVVLKPRHFFGRDFIDLLMVAERHRRRGLGSMVMSAAVEAASTQEEFTSTNESNVPMQALLVSKGWEFSGKLDGLDQGDPELVYCKRR